MTSLLFSCGLLGRIGCCGCYSDEGGGDPEGNATTPLWQRISARELYDHQGDDGSAASGEKYEWTNLAHDPEYAELVGQLHEQLKAVVQTGLVRPIIREPSDGVIRGVLSDSSPP